MRIGDWVQQHYYATHNPNTGEEYECGAQHLPLSHEKHTIICMCIKDDMAYTCSPCVVWVAIRSNTTGKVRTIVGGDFETLDQWCLTMNHMEAGDPGDLLDDGFPLPEGVVLDKEVYQVKSALADEVPVLTANDFEVVTPKLYVNTYLEDRAYGGPEEGGWYYDCGTAQPESNNYANNEEAAERMLAAGQLWCDVENAERNSNTSSVASEGRYTVRREAWPAESWPTHRPHYS